MRGWNRLEPVGMCSMVSKWVDSGRIRSASQAFGAYTPSYYQPIGGLHNGTKARFTWRDEDVPIGEIRYPSSSYRERVASGNVCGSGES